jgi:hypothetical protein
MLLEKFVTNEDGTGQGVVVNSLSQLMGHIFLLYLLCSCSYTMLNLQAQKFIRIEDS